MPSQKRYAGVMNCYIPAPVRRGIMKVAEMEGKTQSEVMRSLLEVGLKTRGLV